MCRARLAWVRRSGWSFQALPKLRWPKMRLSAMPGAPYLSRVEVHAGIGPGGSCKFEEGECLKPRFLLIPKQSRRFPPDRTRAWLALRASRSEEHTSELQSLRHLV